MKFGQEGILLSQAGHTYIRRSDSSGKMPCKKTNNFRGRSSPKHLVVAAAAAATDSDQSEVCLLSYFYEIPANPSLKQVERTFHTKQTKCPYIRVQQYGCIHLSVFHPPTNYRRRSPEEDCLHYIRPLHAPHRYEICLFTSGSGQRRTSRGCSPTQASSQPPVRRVFRVVGPIPMV